MSKPTEDEVKDYCDEINARWLVRSGASVSPYYYNDEWRVKLVVGEDEYQHFCPGTVGGHSFYLFVQALQQARVIGIGIGKSAAVDIITTKLREILK